MRGRSWLSIALLAGVATLATVGRASATLQLTIFENGAYKGTVVDQGAGDSNLDPNAISASGAFLTGLGLTTVEITALGASSNAGSTDDGQLSQNGSMKILADGNLDIVANDTDYTVPDPQSLMSSTASTSGTNTNAGDIRTFQSFFDPSNTAYPPLGTPPPDPPAPPGGLSGVPSPLITHLLAPVPPSPNQGSYSDTVILPLLNSGTYALSNWSFFSYASGAGNKVIGWSGQTIISGVPEPTTVAMILGGLPLIAVGAWRRRRAA